MPSKIPCRKALDTMKEKILLKEIKIKVE
jgi:hypothetical protein